MSRTLHSTNIETVLYITINHYKYLAIHCYNLCCYQGIMCEGKFPYPATRLHGTRSQNAVCKRYCGGYLK
jgi:hypothetical protein